jgi:hypothetical protein
MSMSTSFTSTQDEHSVAMFPELVTGDEMTQAEFHRAYEMMPVGFKAELIGGIVYVASPLKRAHGKYHLPLGSVFFAYETATPGVEAGDNTTIILGPEGEPQPDLFLRILPEFGGQSRTSIDDYLLGPPELLGEISHSSRAIDLHAKKRDFARYGVLEYLVLCLREQKLWWFDLQADQERHPDDAGIIRVQTFPGLWINVSALLARDHRRLMETLNEGLSTSEHANLIERLASQMHS